MNVLQAEKLRDLLAWLEEQGLTENEIMHESDGTIKVMLWIPKEIEKKVKP
jgi:hypothetical protein